MSQLIPANPGFLATTPPPGFSDPVIGVSVLFLALCLSSLWCVHRVTKSCRKRKRHSSPATSPEEKQSGIGERVEVQPIPFLLPSGASLHLWATQPTLSWAHSSRFLESPIGHSWPGRWPLRRRRAAPCSPTSWDAMRGLIPESSASSPRRTTKLSWVEELG